MKKIKLKFFNKNMHLSNSSIEIFSNFNCTTWQEVIAKPTISETIFKIIKIVSNNMAK